MIASPQIHSTIAQNGVQFQSSHTSRASNVDTLGAHQGVFDEIGAQQGFNFTPNHFQHNLFQSQNRVPYQLNLTSQVPQVQQQSTQDQLKQLHLRLMQSIQQNHAQADNQTSAQEPSSSQSFLNSLVNAVNLSKAQNFVSSAVNNSNSGVGTSSTLVSQSQPPLNTSQFSAAVDVKNDVARNTVELSPCNSINQHLLQLKNHLEKLSSSGTTIPSNTDSLNCASSDNLVAKDSKRNKRNEKVSRKQNIDNHSASNSESERSTKSSKKSSSQGIAGGTQSHQTVHNKRSYRQSHLPMVDPLYEQKKRRLLCASFHQNEQFHSSANRFVPSIPSSILGDFENNSSTNI